MAFGVLPRLASLAPLGAQKFSTTPQISYEHLKYTVLAGPKKIGLLFLSRPPVNALSSPLLQELAAVTQHVKQTKLHALILSSEGRAFSAGAELSAFEDPTLEKAKQLLRDSDTAMEALHDLRQRCIVISALQGSALGGGLELALRTDRIVAASIQRPPLLVGLPEAKLGLCPGAGGTVFLPLKMQDQSLAERMIEDGEVITVEEAHKYGLVDRIFSETDFIRRVVEYTEEIMENPQEFLRSDPFPTPELTEALREERARFWSLFESDRFKEWVRLRRIPKT